MTLNSREIVLASNNQGKLREFGALLRENALSVHSMAEFDIDEAEETAITFVENALLKARHVSQHSGLPAIADDSGLEVDALNGAPGIYSARYAGPNASDDENVRKLLDNLADVRSMSDRSARFHCVIVLLRHPQDPTPLICHGVWEGQIQFEPTGDNGFGYDPVFYVPTHDCSAAELGASTKNALSHRGQALHKLLIELE